MSIKLKLIALLFIGMLFSISCEQFSITPETQNYNQSFPTNVELELPSAISSYDSLKNFKALSGEGINNYLRNFVQLGYGTIEIINNSYQRIININPEGASEFTYTGLDGKTKYVSIKDSVLIDSVHWDYSMEIYDNSFSNLALQVFWNIETAKQLIICNVNQLNHDKMENHPDAIITIEYNTQASVASYEQSIYIGVSKLTTSDENPYAPDNIKLFFGINKQIINFIGSSNNPNVTLYDTDLVGKNWSFRGKADLAKNLAVLELALPETELENTENMMLNFSLKNVILQELKNEYDYIGLSDEEILADRNINAANIESPSFFNSEGFEGSGANIPTKYTHLSDFSNLAPFIPLEVKNYEIEFTRPME